MGRFLGGCGSFLGGCGWLWVVMVSFWSFWVFPCFSSYALIPTSLHKIIFHGKRSEELYIFPFEKTDKSSPLDVIYCSSVKQLYSH